ncbi:hypothetical protein [Pedobacter ureilyticus]|uniref:DUF5362 domain-containing protein n=1 Tax=Pedobacter ureilyticus TaxID=1393051 RepID=A0ABW9J926_9SPHI|nr:hypothetical protein [Pedobacter helvus]
MEDQAQFQETENQKYPQLIVTEDMRSYIYDMAKWANFLGIVGLVIAAFMLMAALTIGPTINANPEMAKMLGQLGAMDGTTFSIVFLIYGLAIFFPSLLMLRYAAKAKHGVLYGEQESLDQGMAKLKSLFKYFGVLTIIFIGLYLLTLVSAVLGGIK